MPLVLSPRGSALVAEANLMHLSDKAWISALGGMSRRRSDIRRARQLVITSLATLGIVLLFGLINYGAVAITVAPPISQYMFS